MCFGCSKIFFLISLFLHSFFLFSLTSLMNDLWRRASLNEIEILPKNVWVICWKFQNIIWSSAIKLLFSGWLIVNNFCKQFLPFKWRLFSPDWTCLSVFNSIPLLQYVFKADDAEIVKYEESLWKSMIFHLY